MNELKQCPFCGGDAEKRYIKRNKLFASMRFPYNTHYVYAKCKVCGATSKVCVAIENAIEAWNRRATMAEYIERRTAIEHLNVWCGGCGSAVECILAEPAADVAPVVHGR